MMTDKWNIFLALITLTIVACHSPIYTQTKKNIYHTQVQMDLQQKHLKKRISSPPPLILKPGPYIDTTPIDLRKTPTWLNSPIVIRGDQLPFSYYSRTISSGADPNLLTQYQPGLDAAVKVSMNYMGTLQGALNTLASKTGYTYTIKPHSIYWQAVVTKTFEIAFMPGSTDYALGKSGGNSAGGGSGQTEEFTGGNDTQSSSISGKLSVWADLEKTIHNVLSPVGKVVLSESTTSVTVTDHPANIALVSQLIQNLNHNLSKQVLVKIQVLELTLDQSFSYGINWSLIYKAFDRSQYTLMGNFATPITISGAENPPTLGIKRRPEDQIPSTQILINALQQQGKTAIVTEPRVVCLNNQVSVISITHTEGYAASVQNTAGVGGTSGGSTPASQNTVTSQINPGRVSTGLILYILPKILKDKLYLQVNASLSTLKKIDSFPKSTSGGVTNPSSQIQLPIVDQKVFNQKSVIKSGDTLILSGFKQVSNQIGDMEFMHSKTLGGKGAEYQNSETIILITPVILPEVHF